MDVVFDVLSSLSCDLVTMVVLSYSLLLTNLFVYCWVLSLSIIFISKNPMEFYNNNLLHVVLVVFSAVH